MKKLVAAVMCLGLVVTAANATHEIEFYFSTQGDVSGIPAEYAAETTLSVDNSATVYLWARTIWPDVWTGVGMQFGSDCADFTVTSGVMYNDTSKGGYQRWENGADLDPTDPLMKITLVAVTKAGLAGFGDPLAVTEGAPDYHYHSLVGEIAFSSSELNCPVYLEASGAGITVAGGTTQENVFFGFGDAPVVNSAPGGTRSALPDLFIVPEPASFMLLGLASLLLRRR